MVVLKVSSPLYHQVLLSSATTSHSGRLEGVHVSGLGLGSTAGMAGCYYEITLSGFSHTDDNTTAFTGRFLVTPFHRRSGSPAVAVKLVVPRSGSCRSATVRGRRSRPRRQWAAAPFRSPSGCPWAASTSLWWTRAASAAAASPPTSARCDL
jgi:hypothetical protein